MTKTLILTGGSQGIGHKTLSKFVAEGWHAINLSRHPSQLSGVMDVAIDLLDPHWMTLLQENVLTQLPASSTLCLIHNAGMIIPDRVGKVDPLHFQTTLALNVVAPSSLNNFFIPRMAKGSSILYVGSTLAEKAVPGCASYIASKHAVVGLMRATCQDLADAAIHTCCVCPGITNTLMLRERCHHDEVLLNALKKLSIGERFIEPEEIAEVLWFAAHHPVINGAVIHANLGQKES